MSFAGLKTAVARAAEAEPLTDARMADICASFQAAIVDVLSEKARRALDVSNLAMAQRNGLSLPAVSQRTRRSGLDWKMWRLEQALC